MKKKQLMILIAGLSVAAFAAQAKNGEGNGKNKQAAIQCENGGGAGNCEHSGEQQKKQQQKRVQQQKKECAGECDGTGEKSAEQQKKQQRKQEHKQANAGSCNGNN